MVLEVEEDPVPSRRQFAHQRGSLGREQLLADLESANVATDRMRRRQRLGGRVDVERDQNRVHACEWAGEVSIVPTRSLIRAMPCRVM